jgi:hypothetical protein
MSDQDVAIGVAVALSSQERLTSPGAAFDADAPTTLYPSAGYGRVAADRVSARKIGLLQESLGPREWAVIRDVARLRLVSGQQLERLHFSELADASRPVVRRRVLGRLVKAQVLATMERRVGGLRAGSAGLVYSLDTAGQRIVEVGGRIRRPRTPGRLFANHVLAVSELYVVLVERARNDERAQLERFEAEPACWWPDGHGGLLKPDTHVVLSAHGHRDHWWVEVDLATETLPALRRKLEAYIDFWRHGQLGPYNVMPRILVTVPDTKRFSDVVRLIRQLPTESEKLFVVADANDAAVVLMRCLNESD